MRKIAFVNSDTDEIISRYVFEEEEFYIEQPSVNTISEIEYSAEKKILNELKYEVDILEPINNGEDFIIRESERLKEYATEFSNIKTPITVKDRCFSEIFPIFKEMNFLKVLQEVYENGEPCFCRILEYVKKQVEHSFQHIIIKNDNYLILLTQVETEFDLSYEKDIFHESANSLIIIYKGEIIRKNKAFINMVGKYYRDKTAQLIKNFNIQNLFNDPAITSSTLTKQEWADIYIKLYDRELFSHSGTVKQKCPNGKSIWYKTESIPVIFDNRPAIQIQVEDITKTKEIELEAYQLKKDIKVLEGVEKIAVMHWDKVNKYNWTDGIYEIIEEEPGTVPPEVNIMKEYLVKDEKEEKRIRDLIRKAQETRGYFTTRTKLQTKSGIKDISISADYSETDEDGDFVIIGYMQDIKNIVDHEKELEQTKKNAERMYKVVREESVAKDSHYKGIYDSVINNYQNILSLLNIENRVNKEDPKKTIEAVRDKINCVMLVYKNVGESADMFHINLKNYINDQTKMLLNIYNKPNIYSKLELESIEFDINRSIPLGLLTGELIINCIKYAFPNNENGTIDIKLNKEEDNLVLIVSDDGVGLPPNFDVNTSPTIGWMIINSLIKQIRGTITQLDQEKGAGLKIVFPYKIE